MSAIHKHFSKKASLAIITLAALFTSLAEYAQSASCDPNTSFCPPTGSDDFYKILNGIARFVLDLGLPVVGFFVVLSGFLFVNAQGNKEKLKTARTVLIWTLVGTAIIVGATPIAKMIEELAKKF